MNWRCLFAHLWRSRQYAFVGEPSMVLVVCERCGTMRALQFASPR